MGCSLVLFFLVGGRSVFCDVGSGFERILDVFIGGDFCVSVLCFLSYMGYFLFVELVIIGFIVVEVELGFKFVEFSG